MNYFVVPWFWGKTFPLPANDATWPSTPYTPQEFSNALKSAAESPYFSRLAQYGAESVIIQEPSSFNDPWPVGSDGYYVTKFTAQSVVDFITQHLPEYGLAIFGKPIFLVIIPSGSLLDVTALGAHSTFLYNGSNVIWAWMYGMPNLDSATLVATHEIVEAIGANGFAPKELCDDCNEDQPDGVKLLGGTTVARYFDAQTNTCVAPGHFDQKPWDELIDRKLLAALKELGFAGKVDQKALGRTGPPPRPDPADRRTTKTE